MLDRASLERLLAADPIFERCLEAGPPRWETRPAGFSGLVHIVLEQQVSTASGMAAFRKLAACLAGRVEADRFSALDPTTLRRCGFSRQKAAYCSALAGAILEGRLDLTAIDRLDTEKALACLTSHRGIGRWTAEIYLMLSCGRPDLWPSGDLALRRGLQRLKALPDTPSPAALDTMAEAWRPHRSLAARLIWHHYQWERGLIHPETAEPASRRSSPAGSRRG